MYVIKRLTGEREEVNYQKVVEHLKELSAQPYPLTDINVYELAQTIIQKITNGINTSQINIFSAQICSSKATKNIQYDELAGRIIVNNHHKNTMTSFKDKMKTLYFKQTTRGEHTIFLSKKFYKFVEKNQEKIEARIDYKRDYAFNYNSFRSMETLYLLKLNGTVVERPQDMLMRVAIFLHMNSGKTTRESLERIFETYDLMSDKYFIHASPTLFNAGLNKGGCLSCFLTATEDDSDTIMKLAKDCAQISKHSGGIGFPLSNIRSKGEPVESTGGRSAGIVRFLQILDAVSNAYSQGKRDGKFAAYLEMHHPDLMEFLQARRPNTVHDEGVRSVSLALWMSDLFVKRLMKGDMLWSFFDPARTPELNDLWGDEYERVYLELEAAGKYKSQIKVDDIFEQIFNSHKETGYPYILFKDQVNRASNQSNIGIIRSSNLCAEIVEHSSSSEYACCTLASICLPKFVEDSYSDEEDQSRVLNHEFPIHPVLNWLKLKQVVHVIVRNLNSVIDRNYYSVPETERSNLAHRPLGIGVQGLADLFFKFKYPWESPEAKQLNQQLFEFMYYHALAASSHLSEELYLHALDTCIQKGSVVINKKEYTKETLPSTIGAYSSMTSNGGSPLFNGTFNWQVYGLAYTDLSIPQESWETLMYHIQEFGVRNSLLIALMPTASTSTLMGNYDSFEPIASNIYSKGSASGNLLIINKYLMNDLTRLNIDDAVVHTYLRQSGGSVRELTALPQQLRDVYKTVWEINQKRIMELSVDRQAFVDQTQSLNLHVENLTKRKLSNMIAYGWKNRLKTCCYYLRSKPAADPVKFTLPLQQPGATPQDTLPLAPVPVINTPECLGCS
jgi:ribonucleoside-diphosphate reductase alpha chain